MTTEIIVALIAATGGIFGSFIGVISSARLTNYRLSQLEKKVEVHNNLIERMYKVEEKLGIADVKMKVADQRIGDLEHQD